MSEEEKIENTIFLKQTRINELKKILNNIRDSETKDIRFRIETKHWYGYSEPFLAKNRQRLNISKESMIEIINLAISKEQERINKCIDMEIEKRNGGN